MVDLPLDKTVRLSGGGNTAIVPLIAVVIVVSILYLGREVLVPVALALLFSFVLAPAVKLLQRIMIPRSISVAIVVLIACSAMFGLGMLLASQVTQLAGDLPRYQTTLRDKIHTLRGATAETSTLERASSVLSELRKELEGGNSNTDLPNAQRPVPVIVREADSGALQSLASLISPLIQPLATTFIVIIFLSFILLQREDLRNRLIKLAGSGDIRRTTAALDDAGERLSKLFLTQLVVNCTFGVVIGFGLWLISVPSAPLWGALGAVLRFIPYLGALLSLVFPLILAAAVGPDWSMAAYTLLLFVAVETVVGQFVEPIAFGHSAGLSPIAVIVAATFWTWVWGPIGLVLATPLTICLVVAGRHIDALKFLQVMFGDESPLSPSELAYQRLLARDPIEITEQSRNYLKENSVTKYYEEILLGALRLGQADLTKGTLDGERQDLIFEGITEIVEDISSRVDPAADAHNEKKPDDDSNSGFDRLADAEAEQEAAAPPTQWGAGGSVLCLGAMSTIDDAAAVIVSERLACEGLGVDRETSDALSLARLFALDLEKVRLICACMVERPTAARVRYVVGRLRKRSPDVMIAIAILDEGTKSLDEASFGPNVIMAYSLKSATDSIVEVSRRATSFEVGEEARYLSTTNSERQSLATSEVPAQTSEASVRTSAVSAH